MKDGSIREAAGTRELWTSAFLQLVPNYHFDVLRALMSLSIILEPKEFQGLLELLLHLA
jgi:hypothetical protein